MSRADYPARLCLAVDLSGNRIRVVRSQHARRALNHAAVFEAEIDEAESVRARLAELAGAAPPSGVLWAACLPVHESLTRWLKAPLASEAKARKVLPSLLDIQLPFSIEECMYLFPLIRRTARGEVEALAAAARLSDLRRRIEILSSLGVDPVVLDHEGLALWSQSLQEQPPREPGRRVVAALYPDHLALVLGETTSGGAAEGSFIGAYGVRPVEALWQAAGQPSTEPALQRIVSRVRQILQAQTPGAAPGSLEWIWTGPGAEDAAWLEELQHHLVDLGALRFLRHTNPSSFLGRALATRALAGAWPCNFRSGSLTHPLVQRHRERQARRTSLSVAAAGLVLCGMALAWPYGIEARKADVQKEIEAAGAHLAPGVRLPYGQELRVVRQALQDRAEQARPFLEAYEPSLASLLVEAMQTARSRGITLDSFRFSAGAVALRGAAADWDRCESLAEPFRRRGLRVALERQDAGLDEKVHFTLKGETVP